MSAKRLAIPTNVRRQILADVARRATLGEEACGLVGGRHGRAELVLPVTNRLHSATRFEMEPGELVRGLQRLEDVEKFELLAIYHSHLQGQGEPSETDRAEFYYPGVAMLIAAADEQGGWKLKLHYI